LVDDFSVSVAPTLNFAKEGFATYYNSEYDVVLPEGMKAKVVTENGSETLEYATIAGEDTGTNVVPAGTAVLLQIAAAETPSEQPIFLAEPSVAAYAGTNLLKGSDVEATTTGGGVYYKLSYNTSGKNIGWYWGAANGAAFTSGAHKAYLVLPASGARFLGLPGFEETTGIVDVNREATGNDSWYTVDGKKLDQQPTRKGLYIQNGVKVVIK